MSRNFYDKQESIKENGKFFLGYGFMDILNLEKGSKVSLLPVKDIVIIFNADEEDGFEEQGFIVTINEKGEIALPDELMKMMGWKVKDLIKTQHIYHYIGYLRYKKKEAYNE